MGCKPEELHADVAGRLEEKGFELIVPDLLRQLSVLTSRQGCQREVRGMLTVYGIWVCRI